MPVWRRATWALVAWNGLMILWFGRATLGLDDLTCSGGEREGFGRAVCEWGASLGLNFGVGLVISVWVIGLVIFGLIWLMTRPKEARR